MQELIRTSTFVQIKYNIGSPLLRTLLSLKWSLNGSPYDSA